MMNSAELETAVRLELDLVVVVLRDDGLGMIKWKQDDMGFRDYGLTLANPYFVNHAAAYGVSGHRVESADQFVSLAEGAFQSGGVHLIVVPIDYSDDQRVLNDEIEKLSARLSAIPDES